MLHSGTDAESYITEYNLLYEDKICVVIFKRCKTLRDPLCGLWITKQLT